MSWLGRLFSRGARQEPRVPSLNIRIDKYIQAGLAALAAGGCNGHWLVCQRCKHEWKDLVQPNPPYAFFRHYCPRCGIQELGSRILAEYVDRLLNEAPQAPKAVSPGLPGGE